ncbi:MAG: ABC transporter substrate-binding protein [Ignavibacteriales bacterium]
MTKLKFAFALMLLLIITGCNKNRSSDGSRVVAGITADIENFSPLYAFSVDEGNISELLYLPLVSHRWNPEKSEIETYPMLASKWEWNEDSSSVILYLRDDVKWSDGQSFTAADVVFSFDAYSDPLVQSRLYGAFGNFYTDSLNHILPEKTFEVISPNKLKINFRPGANAGMYDIDFPILPGHVFDKVERKSFSTAAENFKPVTDGPYQLKEWKRNQFISLKADPRSFLHKEGSVNSIIFKVIPDYNNRILQLKKGEIDLLEEIKSNDASALKEQAGLNVVSVKGREYDYVGWNNIDPASFIKNNKIVPHKLFGTPAVRKALTYAINRQEIIEEFLNNYGEICSGPISPIFRQALNREVSPYGYNPEKARELLKNEGWRDRDNDGILEKGTQKFSFTLAIPGGNPRRAFAASVIKHNLRAVGIDVRVETLELGYLIDNLNSKKLDAWIVSLYIPLPFDLKSCWHSDLKAANLNFASYRNKNADYIIEQIQKTNSPDELNNYYKKIQMLLHEDEPVSFLYWVDNVVAYNKKIKNIKIDPLGVIHDCWEWSTKD